MDGARNQRVEAFDARGVSFVSVTQQFNTSTSMGRLMLNVLLSFAQFEREVTGERIRDKIAASKKTGTDWVEIHTGAYANAMAGKARERELLRVAECAKLAASLGLRVGAGHGLNYHNVQPVAALTDIVELNIGHAIISHALFVGLATAVREMKGLMLAARA
jgi:pyridoxine 5'-phosphate synthase PdxJ